MSPSRSRHLTSAAAAAILLGLLAWQGHHLAHQLPQLERSLSTLGPRGPLVYVATVVLLAPLLVPDSIFGVAAGVVFGLGAGFVYYFSAIYVACLLAYFASRRWLRTPVLATLATRPALREMVTAASQQGVQLTFWIRLVPINPLLVSYGLGAVGVSLRAVAIGTLGMFPHMFLTVYLGVAAAHVTRMAGEGHAHWTAEGLALLLGLAACAVLVLGVSSRAWSKIRASTGGSA